MKMHYLTVGVFILVLIVAIVYGRNSINLNSPKTTYVHHFPEKQSPPLNEFMKYYLTGYSDIQVFKIHSNFIFAFRNVSSNEKEIEYYQYTREQLENYYEPLLNTKQPGTVLNDLEQNIKLDKFLRETINNVHSYNLPSIKMEDSNQLKIELGAVEKTLDLPKLLSEYSVKEKDEIIFNILEINDNHFVLKVIDKNIQNSKGWDLEIVFFIKNDLTDIVISESYDEAIQQKLNDGTLDDYLNGFEKVGSNGRYLVLFGSRLIDKKVKKIVEIREGDYLSNDGQYVYIGGAKDNLEDGIQKIQTIENYAAGNDKNQIEYNLDYEEIAKELDFTISGIGSATINYFNENYLVLRLDYNGKFVGTAGATNVMIDFQENKENPAIYLINLGME
ncbi:hypothetical protein [Metabacillus fastidiosus]|uniref:hypothetical protein n=1 Tax=Metabacillus fastidiosus TaxID=1458 RepID=UPI002DBE8E39|nr:hypothetical protein [Metabacillus fastidiosus]MEC2075133.1 hypothetical protein [Metabacillus fastidiosus]